ncbi:hypothetical protein [Ruania alba]|uniref:Uncharacterized protein n=1 Tax=Ruania alba TaxID=648782 RepID=A0A1H5MU04_9MICO|nr:hypothetical protein [Ruania alba]SEE92766.1 hypothetical protein SAMN04488554_3640 [Ruania alba]
MPGTFTPARALQRAVRSVRGPGAFSPVALVSLLTGWSVLSVVLGRVLLPAECVRADGMMGFLAANLAQMRSVAECPTGTLGYGPHTAAVVAGFGTLLAAAVTAHLAASGLVYWLTRAARAVQRALLSLAARLPRARRAAAATPRPPLRPWVATATQIPTLLPPVWRRGPPVLA